MQGLDELARVTVLNDNEPQYDVGHRDCRNGAIQSLSLLDVHERSIRFSKDVECEVHLAKVPFVECPEIETGMDVFRSSHLDGVRCVAFHPVESMVITGSEDRTLKLWNLEKAAVLRK